MQSPKFLFKQLSSEPEYIIKHGDCLSILKTLDDGKFDLILTSPPYNVGKAYETKTSIEQYLETQTEIIAELIRTLSDTGNLCWQVGNYVDKGEVFPLDIFYYQIFKKYGLKLRNRIIWHFGNGVGSTIIGAIKHRRNGIGIEKEQEYCQIANKRIDELKAGRLKIRPINKPIHKPKANDKVAQIPREWKWVHRP